MKTNIEALRRCVDILKSKRATAEAMGVSPQFVSLLLSGESELPPKRCVKLSVAVGGEVSCHDLRPDIFPADFEKRQVG